LGGEEVLNELRSHDATKDITIFILSQRSDSAAVAAGVFHNIRGYFVKADMTLDAIVEKIIAVFSEEKK
jgi:DNA-binding NarL/FixJ family response regulator